MDKDDRLMTSGEVADEFRVCSKTVGRWAARGWLPHVRTLGGHRRFRKSDVKALLEGGNDLLGENTNNAES